MAEQLCGCPAARYRLKVGRLEPPHRLQQPSPYHQLPSSTAVMLIVLLHYCLLISKCREREPLTSHDKPPAWREFCSLGVLAAAAKLAALKQDLPLPRSRIGLHTRTPIIGRFVSVV